MHYSMVSRLVPIVKGFWEHEVKWKQAIWQSHRIVANAKASRCCEDQGLAYVGSGQTRKTNQYVDKKEKMRK